MFTLIKSKSIKHKPIIIDKNYFQIVFRLLNFIKKKKKSWEMLKITNGLNFLSRNCTLWIFFFYFLSSSFSSFFSIFFLLSFFSGSGLTHWLLCFSLWLSFIVRSRNSDGCVFIWQPWNGRIGRNGWISIEINLDSVWKGVFSVTCDKGCGCNDCFNLNFR